MARAYLMLMALDDGPSSTGELASRMRKTPQYASVYRARLIREDYIKPAGRGYVEFTMPFMREYLRQYAAFNQLEQNLEDMAMSIIEEASER